MNALPLLPLFRGALALRPRYAIGPKGVSRIAGLEVVEVLAVNGQRVTWTNHKPSKFLTPGVAFSHTSHRRELIALDAIEFPACDTPATDEKSAVTETLAGAVAG